MVEAGLPGVIGQFEAVGKNISTGPFRLIQNLQTAENFSTGAWVRQQISFDLSRVSDLYGNSDTNQVKAIRGVWIVKYT